MAIISSDDAGRCQVLSLECNNNKTIKLFNVYFPCFESSAAYFNELDHCLGFIDSIVCVGDNIIVLGDLNFRCYDVHSGFRSCSNAFSHLDISDCDSLYAQLAMVLLISAIALVKVHS